MKAILTQDLPNVGQKGQLVNVKPGFFRNFLFPRGYAVLATKNLIEKAETINAKIEADLKAKESEAKKLKEVLEAKSVKLSKKLTKKGSLYSKVSEKELATAILEQFDISVSDSAITIRETIKTIGEHTASLKLAPAVTAVLKVLVEDESKSDE